MDNNNTKLSFIHDLVKLAVSRPVAVTMVVIAVTVFGFVSYNRLPVNLMPDISYPTLTIRTEYPGSAPEEVEKNVTERIEEALAAISNLVSYSSTSKSEVSDVILEFSWDTNMSLVIQEVREKLDRVGLPNEATRPLILRYDPTLDPIMRLGIYGDASLFELRDVSEFEVKRALETISGVASVKIKGGLEEEILIDLEEQKLVAYKIPINTVLQRLREENLNTPCGSIREGERTYLVRTKNEFKNLDEIKSLPIVNKDGISILLKEIATVTRTSRESEIITRIGEDPSVEIEIYKEADANIVKVCDAVKWKLFGMNPQQKEEEFSYSNSKNNNKQTNPQQNNPRKKVRGSRNKKNQNQNQNNQNQKNKGKNDEKKKDKKSRGKQNNVTWITAELPESMELEVLSDQSEFIRHAIEEVINTCITGGFLAVIVLFLFLRRPMNTIIIAITIPICVIVTFAPLHLSQTSLNIMSLGGLALGIGMLVDNAIVVLESIVRHRNLGKDAKESAVTGTSEVGGAIIASTLTTVAVFFPILYIEGIAGQIFKDQALTVVFSLFASLAMAVVVIPVLASRSFRAELMENAWRWSDYLVFRTYIYHKNAWQHARWYKKAFIIIKSAMLYVIELATKLALLCVHLLLLALRFSIIFCAIIFKILFWPLVFMSNLFRSWGDGYRHLLAWILKHPIMISFCLFAIIFSAFQCLKYVGAELVPELHQGEFSVHISLPVGSPLEKTDKVIQTYERFFMEQDEILQVFSHIGAEKTSTNNEGGSYTGVVTCILDTEIISSLEEDNYLNKLRQKMPYEPEVKSVRFTRPTLFSFKTPLEIELYGHNLDELKKIADEALFKMQSIKEIYDAKLSVERGNPELHISYDRYHLFKNNLNMANVANLIRSKIQGENVGKFRLQDKEIPIIVRLQSKDRNHVDSLNNMVVNETEGRTYLREVGKVEEGIGPSEIRHIQQQRVILITANIYGLDLQGAANKIESFLAKMQWPEGYKYRIGGQSKEQRIATNSMQLALFLAAFLVYAIMASQFESLFQPLIIMFTLPLAFIGVIIALVIGNIPVSIIVLIGIIVLCGIVVNNAIVMIDYINQLRDSGLSIEEAVLDGAQTRLRPILMTTLTTLLGLLPMTGLFASGTQGIEIRSPLAITVISGLLSSTLLTLVIIPVVYTYGEKLRQKLLQLKNK